MFDISSLKSNHNFDGFMCLSDGTLLTVTLSARPRVTSGVGVLGKCETCSMLADRVYLIAPAMPYTADPFYQCQTCLHESMQTSDESGDVWYAPLSM